jgi:hypothetical protein
MPLSQVFWNSPLALPVAVACALLMLAAVAWLYPPQVKELRWPWRWGLPLLRAAALLALAASLIKPGVLRPKAEEERGAILLLVDKSRSMVVTDNARTPAQMVALADGLGRLPNGVRSKSAGAMGREIEQLHTYLDRLRRSLGDLEYARVVGRGVEGARQRAEKSRADFAAAVESLRKSADTLKDRTLIERIAALADVPQVEGPSSDGGLTALRTKITAAADAAAHTQAVTDEHLYRTSEQVRQTCDELARLTRADLVEHAVAREETGLLARLGSDATVLSFAVADDVTPIHVRAGTPSATAATASTEPLGRRSDIAGAVRRALDQAGGREVSAVVFFSDGRQVGGDGAVTAGLTASGVPVLAVAVAPENAVRDLAFAGVSLPASGFVGEGVTVTAEVRSAGQKDATAEVQLDVAAPPGAAAAPATIPTASPATAPSAPPQQTAKVAIRGGEPATASFTLKFERPGAQQIVASIPAAPDEATGENNRVRRWVKVVSQRMRVAAFASQPGWDFQYLRNALSRTAWVELQAGVLGPAGADGGGGARLPLSPEQILQLDVLVLSDVPVAALDDSQWDAVYRLVSDRGGSLVMLAGGSHLPAEYGGHLVASSLLPHLPDSAIAWRMWPGEQPMFRVMPDAAAVRRDFLRLDEDPGESLRRWQGLPAFYRFLSVGRLKQTAEVLLIEPSSGFPVLTQNRVGSGRTLLLGADETWRWRFKAGEAVQDRFWLQLIRHAAGEPYAVRSERLALDADRVAVAEGEQVSVRVRVYEGVSAAAVGEAGYRVEVIRGDQTVGSARLTPVDSKDPLRFSASVGPFPPGDYELCVIEPGEASASPQSPRLPLQVGTGYEAELADVTADYTVLRRLADASNGEFYTLEHLDRLIDRLRQASDRRPRYVEQRLWDSAYLFVFVVACLAAEWAARKRLGLA